MGWVGRPGSTGPEAGQGENSPYGFFGEEAETPASFEARARHYPNLGIESRWLSDQV
jgi:hypothetical protein